MRTTIKYNSTNTKTKTEKESIMQCNNKQKCIAHSSDELSCGLILNNTKPIIKRLVCKNKSE